MFNTQFFFITILLLLFVFGTFYYRVPRTSIPLFLIYIYFVFISDRSNTIDEIILNDESDNYRSETLSTDKESKSNDIVVKPIKPTFEPKPLTFDLDNEKVVKNKNLAKKLVKSNQKKKKNNDVEKKIAISGSELVLKDIIICKNIAQRTPVGADNIFTNNVDSLYCYSRIKNPGEKKEIKHAWYYENKLMTQVRYNIKKSNTYRSWTKKTILPSQIGNWRVDIHDDNGTIIGSKNFKIVKIEN